jgi:hypothetical protein
MIEKIFVSKANGGLAKVNAVLESFKEGVWEVTIEPHDPNRTPKQSRLMYLWFDIIAKEIGEDRTSVKEIYIKKFSPIGVFSAMGDSISRPKRTSEMSKKEMSEFMDRIFGEATGFLGIILPVPDDSQYGGDNV